MIVDNAKSADEKKDVIRNTLIATTSLVPVAGGILSFFLDKYLPSAVEARRSMFLTKVEEDLEKIPRKTIEEICNNPEYTSIIIKVFRNALEEDKIEKINAFRNILINATLTKNITFNEQSFYVKLITDLTIDQIRILHLFYLRDYKKTLMFGNENNLNRYLEGYWKDVDESYRFALVTELIRYGIITGSEKAQKANNGSGHYLSPFGGRFIEFIFSPVETDKTI
jgi:hypothetical protein